MDDLDLGERHRQGGARAGCALRGRRQIRRAGNRVRITSQLIDAGTGHHLWADRYDRELADMPAVQDEIAQRISAP